MKLKKSTKIAVTTTSPPSHQQTRIDGPKT